VLSLVRKHHLESRIILQSFDFRTLHEMKKQAPEIKLAALYSGPSKSFVEIVKEAGADMISPEFKLVTPLRVKEAHDAGIPVVPWTADTPEDWDRLIAGTSLYSGFRDLFGDETQDYQCALQRHYNEGPPRDWRDWYVSAYASAHPWEDWAETWAHYLHIADTWDTALSFGMDVNAGMEFDGFTHSALASPDRPGSGRFLEFLNSWTQLTTVLNELSRAMGLADFYPFVLSQSAVAKLHFVHHAIVTPV